MADDLLWWGLGALVAGAAGVAVVDQWSPTNRARRVLRKMPSTPIREFSEGAVGKIEGKLTLLDEPLLAPGSGERCGYFHTVLETHGRSRWVRVKKETECHLRFEVTDETGVALVELLDDTRIDCAGEAEYKKSIATAEPPPELERYLRRIGNPVEGFAMRLRERVVQDGVHVAVLGQGRWEPWSDPRAIGGEYRSQGKRLVVRQSAGSPFLFRA